jgi:hypothetical protein
MKRRDFVKAGAALAAVPGSADPPAGGGAHLWDGYDFGPAPRRDDRLDQGPFTIDQDQGWYTIEAPTPAAGPVRNFGLGLVGYTWEENGPALAVRRGEKTLGQAVEALAATGFVDVLYIRCDWRDVQARPGRLDLHPVWDLTLDAARRHGLRVGFRVQMSSPEIQPARLSIPDFLKAKVPLVPIGALARRGGAGFVEPRYDHPEFQRAFRELNELLGARFDGDPLLEFVDLMMYGFWGEGHTSDLPSPFPDPALAERTFLEMTRVQLETWKRTPLAVNTQPDISRVGNDAVLDRAVRGGCWLRSDSVILDEPVQIEELAHRPPWLAVVMEDGYFRHYDTGARGYGVDAAGVGVIDKTMLHALDVGANYWSLWTEAESLARYREAYPDAFRALQARIGWRVRPAWVWQRKRGGAAELVVAFANDGVAGVPGLLQVIVETTDGKRLAGGSLDAGHPHPGRLRQASFILPRELEGRPVKMRVEIEVKGARRPVRWACAQPLNEDGSLTLRLKARDDASWRKGI